MPEPCNRKNMLTWIEALESGRYPAQATGVLRDISAFVNTGAPKKYCCLGVATEEAVICGVLPDLLKSGQGINDLCERNGGHGFSESHDLWCQRCDEILPDEVAGWLGIGEGNPSLPWLELEHSAATAHNPFKVNNASGFNDSGMSFVEIARRLRIRYLGEEDPGPVVVHHD